MSPAADSICIFCPTPILTVTIENGPEGDGELHLHAGGQGFWVASMIARLGTKVVFCAPFGGDVGRLLEPLVTDEEEVEVRAIPTAAASGSYVHDRRTGDRVEICRVAGKKLTRHEYDDLYNATFAAAMNSRLLVLTGQFPAPVIPAEAFQRLASDLKSNGRYVIADLSGDDLNQALTGGVEMLCFSHEELGKHGFAASDQIPDLLVGLDKLHERGANNIILHRGAEPTIARLNDRFVEVLSPNVTPADHRGGGDTFLAALAVGLARDAEIEETLRFAAAAATLNVTRHGLGTGHVESIVEMSRHVQIRPL